MKKYNLFIVIIAFIVGFAISKLTDDYKVVKVHSTETTVSNNSNFNKNEEQSNANPITTSKSVKDNKSIDDKVPSKVYSVIEHIKKFQQAPDGYVGGRQFMNYEKLLPQFDANGNKISYQEWDVNPKIEGKNRGKERLVTGSDGKAYYTNDHYQSFIEVEFIP